MKWVKEPKLLPGWVQAVQTPLSFPMKPLGRTNFLTLNVATPLISKYLSPIPTLKASPLSFLLSLH